VAVSQTAWNAREHLDRQFFLLAGRQFDQDSRSPCFRSLYRLSPRNAGFRSGGIGDDHVGERNVTDVRNDDRIGCGAIDEKLIVLSCLHVFNPGCTMVCASLGVDPPALLDAATAPLQTLPRLSALSVNGMDWTDLGRDHRLGR